MKIEQKGEQGRRLIEWKELFEHTDISDFLPSFYSRF